MAPRLLPGLFIEASIALDYRPPRGTTDLPDLTAEQDDFPRGERDMPATGAAAPAAWSSGMPTLDDDPDAASTTFEPGGVVTAAADAPTPEHDEWGLSVFEEFPRTRSLLTSDAIASYASWHLHGDGWGIRISARALETFVRYLAGLSGIGPALLRPLVARQVLMHEWAHLAGEIMATELELSSRRVFYPSYLRHRYGQAPAPRLPGFVEEAIASHREVAFARGPLPRGLRPKPAGYLRVVKDSLATASEGYRDWNLMERASDRARLLAGHLDLMTGHGRTPALPAALSAHALGVPTPGERTQVPYIWLGDPAVLGLYGLQPKTASAPTIKRFEKWLRKIGCPPPDTRGGKGSHRKATLPNGRRFTYAAGHGLLLPPEAKQLVVLLGLTNLVELYDPWRGCGCPPSHVH